MYSIDSISKKLTRKLKEYLEAQYPLTNPELQQKRKRLLQNENMLSTDPYIESTPVYQKGKVYSEMRIPEEAKELMDKLSKLNPSVGVYEAPYEHQTNAIESFLGDEKDLIISTGTGSGKTESFLHPMLNQLYIEAKHKPNQFKNKRGVRALILYPMNALVNDQMSRLRLLYGNEAVKDIFIEAGGRPVQFGMYTSRTPYAGAQTYGKDRRQLDPLLDYYLGIENNNPELLKEMQKKGRMIAKNLNAFKNSKVKKTKDPYKTSFKDAELFTRHEMHLNAPDILVTNYSMLEYMMMRPIERSIWDDTKEWLAESPDNEFLLVLDEAHMYRGTSGAEVALLIRRLQQRLGIDRERIRCILTSASLGEEGDTQSAVNFASKLTGNLAKRSFQFIEGIKEERGKTGKLSEDEVQLLAKIDIDKFHNRLNDYESFYQECSPILNQLSWGDLPIELNKLETYLYEKLDGFPPLEKIISLVSGKASTIETITKQVSSHEDMKLSQQAISNLIILANAAKLNDRVLLPARVHMFFRGISGLYLCLNPNCTESNQVNRDYGNLYDTSRVQCDCGTRVYEVLTHLFCGSAFIRVYVKNEAIFPKYTWNEKGLGILDEGLTELHIYIEETHSNLSWESGAIKPVWIDLKTGYLFDEINSDMSTENLFRGYITNKESTKRKVHLNRDDLITFEECPSCARDSKGNIRDLQTKGEPPFANLVRQQFVEQPPRIEKIEQRNQGRKVLIFSDGRQKAARLARDIPRETEKDVLRQITLLLANEFGDIKVSYFYNYILFLLKLGNIEILEGKDKLDLESHRDNAYELIKDEYMDELSDFKNLDKELFQEIINDLHQDNELYDEPEDGFETSFYQTLIAPGYSLYDSTVGYLAPRKKTSRYYKKIKHIMDKNEFYSLCVLFIKSMQDNIALNEMLSPIQREAILSSYRQEWGVEKHHHYPVFKKLLALYGEENKQSISEALFGLCSDREGKYYIDPRKIVVKNGLDNEWYKCDQCRTWHPVIVKNVCPTCLSGKIAKESKNQELDSEKGYWRAPVREVINGAEILNFNVEEHSAQLSQKDVREALATTEKFELGFQDIQVEDQSIVDILSCTTTMEVGVDIGTLTAVAMRNIPPFRENYQQRAGRAGRRSTNLSTVITYAQDSPHDHYYFANPDKMISGEVRTADIYIDNSKILKRHLNALLIQTYFHENLQSDESDLYAALGETIDFFEGTGKCNINHFEEWLVYNTGKQFKNHPSILEIIPEEVIEKENESAWRIFLDLTGYFVDDLRESYEEIKHELSLYLEKLEDDEGDIPYYQNKDLLMFLFNYEYLPTYAFPRSLSSLYIEKPTPKGPIIAQRPQQELNRALSEYAPGKLIVINKETYRIEGIYNPYDKNSGESIRQLFQEEKYIAHCPECYFSQLQSDLETCPNCNNKLQTKQYIKPVGFSPEAGRSLKRNEARQEYSYATTPQLPTANKEIDFEFTTINNNIQYAEADNEELIVLNRGSKELNGFKMCVDCGFITPDGDKVKRNYHYKPFLTHGGNRCDGHLKTVYLGNNFKTDILLVRMNLSQEIYFEPVSRWIHDALETISEAFIIAATRVLEIDIDELNIGYRMYKDKEDHIFADLYVFDKLSGGAGYSYLAAREIDKIFKETEEILSHCEGNCDKSCYKCLRHYNNQFKHSILDRNLALDLLTFILKNKTNEYSNSYQLMLLEMIQSMNEILNIESDLDRDNLEINLSTGYKIKVRNTVVQPRSNERTLYYSPYEIINDLPNVHENIKEFIYAGVKT